MPGTRPERTTMEGMIWNANHVLDSALDPKTVGIPRDLFKACKGIVLISAVEAGFVFSGNVGTGVVMARGDDGQWSPPSAIGLGGMGFGFMAGAEVKDIVIVVMDQNTMSAFSGDGQIKFGGQVGLTAGPVGRELDLSLNLSNKGAGGSFAYTFSQGLFGGVALEGAAIGARRGENNKFYGNEATPQQILFESGSVEIKPDSGILELHKKLEILKEGSTAELTAKEASVKESKKEEANKAAEEARASQHDVVPVEEEKAAQEAAQSTASIQSAAASAQSAASAQPPASS